MVEFLEAARLCPRLAVSGSLDEVTQAPAGYRQARDGLRLARVLQPGRRIVPAKEMTMLARFLQMIDSKDTGERVFPAVLTLLLSDRHQHGSLVQSLDCLLENDWNVSTAARQFGIHRNTLLNRLERIEEILCI